MAIKFSLFLSLIATLSLLFARSALTAEAPPPCDSIIQYSSSCLAYIEGSATTPSQECCDGVKAVASTVTAQADRVLICNCLKQRLSGLKYDPSTLSSLPKKCAADIDIPPISSSTDCSKVSM